MEGGWFAAGVQSAVFVNAPTWLQGSRGLRQGIPGKYVILKVKEIEIRLIGAHDLSRIPISPSGGAFQGEYEPRSGGPCFSPVSGQLKETRKITQFRLSLFRGGGALGQIGQSPQVIAPP
jgi:hypothetical protein